jgi:hypothetical protein
MRGAADLKLVGACLHEYDLTILGLAVPFQLGHNALKKVPFISRSWVNRLVDID